MAEKVKKCKYPMLFGKPCLKELYDGKHCIFHSEDVEGKKKEFNVKFWKEFKRQDEKEKIYDFTGFVFPNSLFFNKFKEIKKDIYFLKAKFFENANLNGVNFLGMAFFNMVKFFKDSNFSLSQFSKFADFGEAEFSKSNEKSDSTELKSAYFTGTEFHENVSFNNSKFHGKATFREVKFFKRGEFQELYFKNVNNLYMDNTYFSNIRGLFEFISDKKKEFKYSKFGFLKLKITEFLPKNIRLILGENVTARFPVISRKIKDDLYLLDFRKKHPCWFLLWKLSADCGRKFRWWFGLCSVIALVFAIIFYYIIGPNSFEVKHLSTSSFWTMLYYSVVTFTTLGFGDVVPKTTIASICVMAEVILGYIMLGGLISIFANKLARRS